MRVEGTVRRHQHSRQGEPGKVAAEIKGYLKKYLTFCPPHALICCTNQKESLVRSEISFVRPEIWQLLIASTQNELELLSCDRRQSAVVKSREYMSCVLQVLAVMSATFVMIARATSYWRFVITLLLGLKHLTVAGQPALTIYCRCGRTTASKTDM